MTKKPTTRKDAERIARSVADAAKKLVPPDCQFAVLVFGETTEDGSYTAYCSTGNREDIARAMLEHVEKVLAT